ncbi:MAG: SDR family NAD(P)-dependent oxidoreductase [Actinobacteria bacterium]|nr:SDR family NAD(P)-dependent oxidoreductase [Actinomycetota bacterium]
MRALVTGGAGHIGSTLVDRLVERGDQVVVLDDFSSGREENLAAALGRGAELVRGDVAEPPDVKAAAEQARPDVVFHLAAHAHIAYSLENPTHDLRINVAGTVNALEAARVAGAHFVFAASCAEYGDPAAKDVVLPLTEDAPLRPISPYGQSKLAAEGYVDLYRILHGVTSSSLRFGNVYGPRQTPLGEAGVVSIFCQRLLEGGKPTVFGTGEQTRDYTYVEDVVDAVIAAADRRFDGAANIGTELETTVLELVAELGRIGGRDDFTPQMAEGHAGDIPRMSLNSARAEAELGWKWRTKLADGLEETVSGWRTRLDG